MMRRFLLIFLVLSFASAGYSKEYLKEKFVFSVVADQKADKDELKSSTIKLIRAEVYKENDIYKVRPYKELKMGIVRVRCLEGTKYWDLDLANDGNFYWQPRLTGFLYDACGKTNNMIPIRMEFLEKLNSEPIAVSDLGSAHNVKELGDLSGDMNLPVPEESKRKKYITVYQNFVNEFKKSEEKDNKRWAKQKKAEEKNIKLSKKNWKAIKLGGTHIYKHNKAKVSWSLFKGQANFFDSKSACRSFGKGWELPSVEDYEKAKNLGLQHVVSFTYPEWTSTNKKNDTNAIRTLTYKSGEGIVFSVQADQGFPDKFSKEYGYRCIKN